MKVLIQLEETIENMYRSRHFDPVKYWQNKPLCVICKKRKVVSGNICSVCREEGKWPNKFLSQDEIDMLNSEPNITQQENEIQEEESPADPRVLNLIGYFHDCAQELLHTLPLVNILNKDNLFYPQKAEGLQKMINDGVSFDQKEGFNIYTELQKPDKELIFGFVFIQGEKTKIKEKALEINAPLLYVRATLERFEDQYIVKVVDDTVSLNQTVLTQLLDKVPEEEIDIRLQEIYQMTPTWPVNKESIEKFILTLQTVFPDAATIFPDSLEVQDWVHEKYPSNTRGIQISTGLIVAKKPEFDGTVVSELLRLGTEAKSGTSLDGMFLDESSREEQDSLGATATGEPYPSANSDNWVNAFPLSLSNSQQQIILGTRESSLSVISGPPGTGKTYTIAAIIIDHILAGKKVLIASRMDKAIEVIVRFLENAVDVNAIARSGGRKQQQELAEKIEKITTTPLKPGMESRESLIKQYKDLSVKINTFTEQYEEALRDERTWANSAEKVDLLQNQVSEYLQNITKEYSTHKAQSMLENLNRADKILKDKSFFLQTWWGKIILSQIKKDLHLDEKTSVSKIAKVLESLKEEGVKRDLQEKLEELDEVNTIWESLQKLQDYQTDVAKRIIQETIASHLSRVIHDHQSRKQLRDFLRSLQLANLKQKLALLKGVSPLTLLEAFGCWASTTSQLSQILPLEPGLFDLVIFDEASQCDLASAIPALYRAKRAVIVGDPKQLHHVVFIGKQAEFAFFATRKINPADQVKYRFSQKSLFDVAIDTVEQKYNYFLDEHYRSQPAIISFPNEKFYGGNLRIMTQHPQLNQKNPVMKIEYVDGVRSVGSVNEKEIERIFLDIREIIDNDSKLHPTTIGIICPFRDQVNAFVKAALKHLTIDEYERHKIAIGTAHTLQGDEKDIVLLSLSVDHDALRHSLNFLETENVFNVAITRAKKRLIVVSSVHPKELRMGLLKEYLEYIESGLPNENPKDKFDSQFEQEVAEALRQKGLNVWSQYPSANFLIDLAVSDGYSSIAVECDGPYHEETQMQVIRDAERQRILERAGWQFVRIPYRLWQQKRELMIEKVTKLLEQSK